MPWKGRTVEGLREEFVAVAREGCRSVQSVCREYGISRKTGYKWLKRAEAGESLRDRSRRPHRTKAKTASAIEEQIITMRMEHPAWGAKKIAAVLGGRGWQLPCIRTVNHILKSKGLIDPEESRKHRACQRFEKSRCNEMWQADFKGDFALLDGSRCYPLTILDDHSRFSIRIDARPNQKGVKDSFRQAFLTYGLPDAILTDNGSPFRGIRGGYSDLERWLLDHDVIPVHGRFRHPQTQGKIERFHRAMKQELLKGMHFTDLQEAGEGLLRWRRCYNESRPHEALGMRCPAEVYQASERTYCDTPKPFEFDGTHHVRKVNNWGYLRFDKWQIYLSEAFSNIRLEIRSDPQGDLLWVCYRNFVIATIDPAAGELVNRKIFRLE